MNKRNRGIGDRLGRRVELKIYWKGREEYKQKKRRV
jgi:hypothetical protein